MKKSSLLSLALVAIGCLSLAIAPPAQAQVTPVTTGVFTNATQTLTNAQTVTYNLDVTVRQNAGVAILPYFCATNSDANENVVFNFQVSADGTNFTTTTPFSLTNVLNGTTAVRGFHLLTADQLNHVQKLRLATIVNGHTNNIWVTNVTYSIRN